MQREKLIIKYSGEEDFSRHSYNKLIRINLVFQEKERMKPNQNFKKQIVAYFYRTHWKGSIEVRHTSEIII